MERKIWAYLVPHYKKVSWIVLLKLIHVLEENARLIFGDVIVDKLYGLERELCQKIIYKMGELFRIVSAH